MPRWSLDDVADAVRHSWSADTCDPVDLGQWSETHKAVGQCGPTALVINDLLGGELMLAEVFWPDGSRQGYHYWNRLPDGAEVDLTREQFVRGERLGGARVVERPPGPPRRCHQQYDVLRARVLADLSSSAH